MLSELVVEMLVPRPWRLGKVSQSTLPTLVRSGKLRPVSTVKFWRVIVPPMVVNAAPPSVVMPTAFTALKSPVISLIPSNEIEPVTPVARAMEPVYVVHEARAVASPPF